MADALDGLTGVADDLDGRLSDVEGELEEFAPRSLAGDVRDLRRDLDALGREASGLSNNLGSDLFYVFLGLQRAFCEKGPSGIATTPGGPWHARTPIPLGAQTTSYRDAHSDIRSRLFRQTRRCQG